MSRTGPGRGLWWSMVVLAGALSVLPTVALAVLWHDSHVAAADVACASPAVAIVDHQHGDPDGRLEEARARCHVDYLWLASMPPQPVPYSTRTWLSEHAVPPSDTASFLMKALGAVALPGYALLLGLAGVRSARKRGTREGAWQTRLAFRVLLLLALVAGAALGIVRHDLGVSQADLDCQSRSAAVPRHLGDRNPREESHALGEALARCNVLFQVAFDGFPAVYEPHSARTWLAPRSQWKLEELQVMSIFLGTILGLALLGLLLLGAAWRSLARSKAPSPG